MSGPDNGTEAEALSEWMEGADSHVSFGDERRRTPRRRRRAKTDQTGRWRCLIAGCNPKLDEASAAEHRGETGHRVAAWPVRSAEGERRAAARNQSGYYDRYNVGAKSAEARGIGGRA